MKRSQEVCVKPVEFSVQDVRARTRFELDQAWVVDHVPNALIVETYLRSIEREIGSTFLVIRNLRVIFLAFN